MKRSWVIECDGPHCNRHMIIDCSDLLQCRQIAMDRDWETAMKAGPEGTRSAWYCPRHLYFAYWGPDREEDHESWCPRVTRHGPCECAVFQRQPHMVDDGFGAAFKTRKGVEVVKPNPELGEIL